MVKFRCDSAARADPGTYGTSPSRDASSAWSNSNSTSSLRRRRLITDSHPRRAPMVTTRFTELVGCDLPLQQAGMGGVAKAELAAAVSAAGALGMLGGAGIATSDLEASFDDIAARTNAPVGVNFLIPFVDPQAVEAAATRGRLVYFFYGDPDPRLIALAQSGGALAAWQVGSAEEAKAAVDAGCEVVIAQ